MRSSFKRRSRHFAVGKTAATEKEVGLGARVGVGAKQISTPPEVSGELRRYKEAVGVLPNGGAYGILTYLVPAYTAVSLSLHV